MSKLYPILTGLVIAGIFFLIKNDSRVETNFADIIYDDINLREQLKSWGETIQELSNKKIGYWAEYEEKIDLSEVQNCFVNPSLSQIEYALFINSLSFSSLSISNNTSLFLFERKINAYF